MTETERPSALTGHTHVREAEDFDSVYIQGVPPGTSVGPSRHSLSWLSVACWPGGCWTRAAASVNIP
jgi:hypothetical protein